MSKQPSTLATPIQKPKHKPRGYNPHSHAPSVQEAYLEMQTRISSQVLGPDASIEDLIACTMLLTYGPRGPSNHPTGFGSKSRKWEVEWLFCVHMHGAQSDPAPACGYLDGVTLKQHYRATRQWEAAMARGEETPKPEPWVPVGRECGHGSNCINFRAAPTTTTRARLSLENLHEWKRDLPLYLRAGLLRAHAQLHRRTNVRRAWARLRRHARAVETAARVAFYWQERTQMALCAPGGAGRAADAAAFAAEF